ncbi:nitrate ABC transporter substrate-binding protein [Actinoplanes cyaneus]|uniref:Thiamine pyrimidine synthase n=1 Tax=Actinoplanes cyaneus TaxID=52696 RepID=A0A919M1W9_9ACTN|nr:ABC transporter substrate-binding protein [Actinoplanes cyaneus]MCW2135780.1 NitT/TauT family transport system substrate-binding protein [Actinoplanes cyaneus]GID62857.1 nitrate ABC transporter substrate-binding protein [Actinoplanes cyaneus]
MKISRIAVASLLALAACGTADTPSTPAPGANGALTPIKLQLQWFYQAQFAGYIAAADQGFYKEQGLDVQLLEGGVDIVPQTVLAQGKADYAVAWVPKALASREQGAGITDVGQIFARSGTYQVAWKDSGIRTAADLKGKKVGNWGFGNEFELFAGMTKAGIDPGKDVTLVQQQFDMQALLKKEIDAAQAMSYNEYAQLLEAKNPATGKLYTADDFSILDWKTEGSSMLQDAVWANTEKLSDPAYQQQTVKFLTATIKGWAFCRDNAEKCRDLVVAKGSKLGKSHQLWQMNEVNKLVWPAPGGVGVVDETAWKQTVDISLTTKNQTGDTVLKKAPEGLAYTNDYIKQAIDKAKADGVDVNGTSFQPATVTLTEGGA